MKQRRIIGLLLVLGLVISGFTFAGGQEEAAADGDSSLPSGPIFITMGTAGVGGMNYPTGIAMASLWNANIPGMKAVAISTGGSPHNIDLLRTDDADVAVCRSLEAYRAYIGAEPYPEEMPWMRALTGGLFVDVFQVVANEDSGIESVADFAGKRIVVGPVGSGGEVDARETLAAYGLTYDDVDVSFVEFSQGMDMLKDGLADAGILGVALGASTMQELMLDGHFKLIAIDDEGLAGLQQRNEFYIRAMIPAETYPNQPEAVATVGTPPDTIIVRADTDENLVYEMTKTLYENRPAIHAVSPLLTQFTEDLVLDEMLIPYHDGAKRYFVEQGWIDG